MSITIGSVTINKNPVYATTWHKERMNQKSRLTSDGTVRTYDSGPILIVGIIELRNVIKSEGDSLRTYITDTAIYRLNSFTITPPAATDLGSGDGVALTTCYYNGAQSLSGVFDYIAPGKYNISFPYIKKV